MLTRVLKTNFEGFRDVAKQLLIWSKNTKAEFCSSVNLDKDLDESFFQKRNDFRPSRNRYDNWNYDRRRNPYFRRKNDFSFKNESNYEGDFSHNYKNKSFFLKNEDVTFNENLKTHVKNFYQPHPDVLNRSNEEINKFREKNDIQIFGSNDKNCPPPIFNFSELDLPSNISDVLKKLNYINPTPVQSQTWPIALSGQNMVGISRTGSGKTLGFMLPALLHIKHQPPIERGEGPIALIMVPTRELAQQILHVSLPFARSLNFRVATLFGGVPKKQQIVNMFHGCEICVATPGRLNDVLQDGFVKLDRCTYFVLDEADRLLDMGFHPQIKSVFHYCRPDRQVSMWSATWPKEVQSLARSFLRNYIAVKFGSSELIANPNIKQVIHVCEENDKFNLLLDLLDKINETDDNKTLIFSSTKLKADRIQYFLHRKGYELAVIHGDKSQRQRDIALDDFRRGKVKILIGTEVVARGIDIDDIRHVINYDFPVDIEGYVHVIGRTARKDRSGTSHSFFTYNDRQKAADLIKILNQANQPINPELQKMLDSQSRGSRYQKNWNF